MENYIVYMYPKSSFVTWPTSDTLFGALCWAYRQLYGKNRFEIWFDRFRENPEFILSSACPCLVQGENKVLFFPKPFLPEPPAGKFRKMALKELTKKFSSTDEYKLNDQISSINKKKAIWKSTKWVSEKIFEKIVKAEWSMEDIWEKIREKGTASSDIETLGNLLITTGERKKIMVNIDTKNVIKDTDIQRNQIDRVAGTTAEGMLFFTQELYLLPKISNLWFLVKIKKPEFLFPLLRYLEDTGIGGERTVGKGHFRLVLQDKKLYEIPQSDDEDTFVSLSRYIPHEAEIEFIDKPSFWNLLNLRPKKDMMFIEGKRVWKSIIRCFQEGSIFSFFEKKEYYGRLIETGITSPYKVYHNGLTIPAFIKIRGSDDES